MRMLCERCGKEIDAAIDYRRVIGWERIRRQSGGVNALRLREPTEVFAHATCVDAWQRGIGTGQRSLDDDG